MRKRLKFNYGDGTHSFIDNTAGLTLSLHNTRRLKKYRIINVLPKFSKADITGCLSKVVIEIKLKPAPILSHTSCK